VEIVKPRDDVEILSRDVLCQSYFRLERYHLRHKLHGGGWSGVLSRELFERGKAAAVLLYDPALDAVVLIQQFRVGALAAGHDPWLTELVAGVIDEGEKAERTVGREAIEEANVAVTDLVPISAHLTSPGGCSETVEIFCGRCDASKAGGVHGLRAEQEDIRVLVVPSAEAFAMRRRHREIYDSSTLLALLWLELERDNLRKRWA
jgi:ADP-ribose pyrophosphatase